MAHHRPRKRFGQHFLNDQNIINKIIVSIEPVSSDHFVEIGPGRGALTRVLLDRVAELDAIEIDRDLADELRTVITNPHLNVHQADALKFDFSQLANPTDAMRLAGNLPYNISSPLLFHILEHSRVFRDIHVMLQKEVAMRIAAEPGNRTYGRLTVALQARCRVQILFNIKPGSFSPPPRVESAFVRLIPDSERRAQITDEQAFNRLVTQAFNMRRKRVGNALRTLVNDADIEDLDIDPNNRAEQLDVESYIKLANFYAGKSE